jgi:hypothetical protein
MNLQRFLIRSIASAAALFLLGLIPTHAQRSSTVPSGAQGGGTHVGQFNFKQEFGPQSLGRRGHRESLPNPQGQGGNNPGPSAPPQASVSDRQELAPVARHQEVNDHPQAIACGGSQKPPETQNSQTGNQ